MPGCRAGNRSDLQTVTRHDVPEMARIPEPWPRAADRILEEAGGFLDNGGADQMREDIFLCL